MELEQFIQDIIQQGKVIVAGAVVPFTGEDIQQATQRLREYYEQQLPELTGRVPAFEPEAAVWAAVYLYRAAQLTVLRALDEDAVNGLLTPFTGAVSPGTILSVDISFRHLPNLVKVAKGLSPEDALVKQIQAAAVQWPFSSVGMKVEKEVNIDVIMHDTCLRRAYIDRIIDTRDKNRCNNELVNEYIKEALGDHGQLLWPGWQPQ
ncbi:hypothetical protein A4H97_05105 [Niastella yeongjuensis]|uniref:MoxR-vWA-beta-propeller ternary system domain-containing protein n=1 Tax=Niastella yeongjuensis TaxID=354355 RepID=A0A1V9EL73_9BACT|nr:hypothetical protein [Niastella yeongjuensis]OQP46900.1 hypothetical protein A4H97_05105 [Niastella yeongjuensis]SEN59569.1 hypothetical protein SAMN05660816_01044 [Niastella yeongjuensis]